MLLVVGGHSHYDGLTFGDLWLLDVDRGVWCEVSLVHSSGLCYQ